jgi:hypothetical protein
VSAGSGRTLLRNVQAWNYYQFFSIVIFYGAIHL